eukprot:PITA_10919
MFKSRLQEYAQKASLPLPENAAAQVAVEDLHKLGLDIHFKVKETKPLKNLLSQFAVKRKIPLPIYQFKKEGMAHCPTFTATVAINGESYTGAPGNNKKAAARNAAYEAIRSIRTQDCNSFPHIELDGDLHKLGLDIHFKETQKLLKNLLSQFAVKRKIPLPIYQFKKEGMAHCPTFTATVEINGESYTGAPGNNKKAAARNAAYEAIRSIRTQDCNSFPQIELDDSKQDSVSDKRETDSKQDSVYDKRETCN